MGIQVEYWESVGENSSRDATFLNLQCGWGSTLCEGSKGLKFLALPYPALSGAAECLGVHLSLAGELLTPTTPHHSQAEEHTACFLLLSPSFLFDLLQCTVW